MICPKCGSPIADGQKFCTNCGAPAPVVPFVQEAMPENVPAEPVAAAPEVTEPVYSEPAAPAPAEPEQPAPVQPEAPAFVPPYQPPQPQAQGMPYRPYPPQGQGAPYQAPQQPQQPPYPNQPQQPFPGAQPQQPFPGAQPQQPYPGAQQPYPGRQQPPYPPQQGQPPFPGAQQPFPGAQPPYPGQQPPKKKSKTGLIIGIIAGAVALIAIILVLVLVVFKEKEPETVTINLNDYVTVTFEGYDTIGNIAEAKFDEDAAIADFADSVKWSLKAKKEAKSLTKMYEPDEFFREYGFSSIYGSIDGFYYDELSNGDTVTWKWEDYGSESTLEFLNIEFEYSDIDVKVSGLTEAGSFDAFEGLTLEVTGRSGDAYAYAYAPSGEIYESFYYQVTPPEGVDNGDLSNGDVVTVSIDLDSWTRKYLLQTFGKLPTSTSKEYTIEGLDFDLTSYSQIPEDVQATLISAPKDALTTEFEAFAARTGYFKLNSIEEDGYWFTVLKEDAYGIDTNRLYVVLKISISCNDQEKTYYWYAKYTDFEMTDGEFHYYKDDEETAYTNPPDRFDFYFTAEDGTESAIYLVGYESMEELSAAIAKDSGEDYVVAE